MKKTIPWDFTCTSEKDFQIDLYLEIEGKLFTKIFNKGKRKLKKRLKLKENIDANLDFIEEFDIPGQYKKVMLPAVHGAVGKIIKQVCRDVLQDGVNIVSGKVENVKYKKQNNKWKVNVIYNGLYVMVEK